MTTIPFFNFEIQGPFKKNMDSVIIGLIKAGKVSYNGKTHKKKKRWSFADK